MEQVKKSRIEKVNSEYEERKKELMAGTKDQQIS
jgi:hypothetical protein